MRTSYTEQMLALLSPETRRRLEAELARQDADRRLAEVGLAVTERPDGRIQVTATGRRV